MQIVYILRSSKNGRYYVGQTSDLANRVNRHNSGLVRSTKPYKPWECTYKEVFPDKKVAYQREMEIKSYKSGVKFKELIKNIDSVKFQGWQSGQMLGTVNPAGQPYAGSNPAPWTMLRRLG